jgi:hypothetical protein
VNRSALAASQEESDATREDSDGSAEDDSRDRHEEHTG